MARHIDDYLDASGADEETRKEFYSLASRIGEVSRNPERAVSEVKARLKREGFDCKGYNGENVVSYDNEIFCIQDVLRTKSGNCLGYPLLIGCILGEKGFEPSYRILVNPKDNIIPVLENNLFGRLNKELRYDKPRLAEASDQDDYPICRFQSLEHLVLDIEGKLFECTSEKNEIPNFESSRDITFQEALSCVYKDRAEFVKLDKTVGKEERYAKAIKLAEKGLELWRDNRQIHSLIASLAYCIKDKKKYEDALANFKRIDGDDSLFNYEMYCFSGKEDFLNKALGIYPMYAEAIALKAASLVEKDKGEARFQYALASHLFANSSALSLEAFYIVHKKNLAKLFGKEKIREIMKGFIV